MFAALTGKKKQLEFDGRKEGEEDDMEQGLLDTARADEEIRQDDITQEIASSTQDAARRELRDTHSNFIAEDMRVFSAKTSPPMDMKFTMPEDLGPDDPVIVQGPHGPLGVPQESHWAPGAEVFVRLGPPATFKVTVPRGAHAGDAVTFEDASGHKQTAIVPAGKWPGDEFDVVPPALMVQVPEGARVGDQVVFRTDDCERAMAVVPEGMTPGNYFAVLL